MSALYGSNDLNAWNEACHNYKHAIAVKNVRPTNKQLQPKFPRPARQVGRTVVPSLI